MKTTVFAIVPLLFLLLFFTVPAHALGHVYTKKVGDFEVSMLSERQGEGDAKILIGTSPEDLQKFLPQGKFPNAVCVYLVKTPDRTYLIDTGFGTLLFENMKSLGVAPEDVDVLLVTHSHGDHIGGMVRDDKATFPKALVYADEREISWSEGLRKNLTHYPERTHAFKADGLKAAGTELFPGIRAIAAHGHTPGHTLFLLESNGEKLLIWGDLTHAMAIQIPRPDLSVTYDTDPAQAARTRKEVLKYAAETGVLVAGMHIAYPGMGKIEFEDREKEIYKFIPMK